MQSKELQLLKIDSSARINGSYSRTIVNDLVETLVKSNRQFVVKERDISNMPFLTEAAVEGMFIQEGQRALNHQEALHISDQLVEELQASDVIVLGVPIYNFHIPATLKAYLDLVVRYNVTFEHTENGSRGLLKNKRAYVVITSAGTVFKSKVDFATAYMQFILGFIGIKEVQFIDATQIAEKGEDTVLASVKQQVNFLVGLMTEEKAVA